MRDRKRTYVIPKSGTVKNKKFRQKVRELFGVIGDQTPVL